jgi:hypothetical protein
LLYLLVEGLLQRDNRLAAGWRLLSLRSLLSWQVYAICMSTCSQLVLVDAAGCHDASMGWALASMMSVTTACLRQNCLLKQLRSLVRSLVDPTCIHKSTVFSVPAVLLIAAQWDT